MPRNPRKRARASKQTTPSRGSQIALTAKLELDTDREPVVPQAEENAHAGSDTEPDVMKVKHEETTTNPQELQTQEPPTQEPSTQELPARAAVKTEPQDAIIASGSSTQMPWSVASFPVFGDTELSRSTTFSTKTPLQEIADATLNVQMSPPPPKPDNVTVSPAVIGEDYDMFQFLHEEYQPEAGALDLDAHLWGYKCDLPASVRLLMSSESTRRLSKFCISLEGNLEITEPTVFPVCLISVNSNELYGSVHPRMALRKNLLADHKHRFQPVFAIPREEFMFPGEEFLRSSKLAEDLEYATVTLNPHEHGALESVIGISGSLNHISRIIRFFCVRSRSSVLQLLVGNLSHKDKTDRAAVCCSIRPGVEIGKGLLPGSNESVVSIPVTIGTNGNGHRWSVEPRLDALAKLCFLNNSQAVDDFSSHYAPVIPIVEYGGLWTQPVFCYDYPDAMATESEGDGDGEDDGVPVAGAEMGSELFIPDSVFKRDVYQTDIVLPPFNQKTQHIHGEMRRLSDKLGISTRTSNVNAGLVRGTRVDLAGDKDKVQKLVETVRDIVP